jgi:hypothetical protein
MKKKHYLLKQPVQNSVKPTTDEWGKKQEENLLTQPTPKMTYRETQGWMEI